MKKEPRVAACLSRRDPTLPMRPVVQAASPLSASPGHKQPFPSHSRSPSDHTSAHCHCDISTSRPSFASLSCGQTRDRLSSASSSVHVLYIPPKYSPDILISRRDLDLRGPRCKLCMWWKRRCRCKRDVQHRTIHARAHRLLHDYICKHVYCRHEHLQQAVAIFNTFCTRFKVGGNPLVVRHGALRVIQRGHICAAPDVASV